ncbi:MAG: ribonuclease activity regulator RraA [Dehalococcoidia bacterium]|nr:ribonuclease activity regulator RraA [Dehalococcoidia bacterium]MSQ34474.1 ribonuclease activity regulator RraA [Dehalococcoidia bacterium]
MPAGKLPSNPLNLPTIKRPSKSMVEALKKIGSATASGELSRLGFKRCTIIGPTNWSPGIVMAGPALTLQFMPKREDVYNDAEYVGPDKQLHRHVLYQAELGDVVVVDARGEMSSGVFGEMMMTYFKGRGGAGVVIDGCLRDISEIKKLGMGLWLKGATPNFHTQTIQYPYAVNVPIACGGVLVMPGDIIIADDDGVVAVPISAAPELVKKAGEHVEWEVFSRMRLSQGGDLRTYYPLTDEAHVEYEAWKKKQSKKRT